MYSAKALLFNDARLYIMNNFIFGNSKSVLISLNFNAG